ncbi:MAG: hypothetical protein DME76_16685 [Verrucomicrobia bacterium]|nr:MAG: hypothetical protein DME76_16685 [Verrucomicrobiota bacterium]
MIRRQLQEQFFIEGRGAPPLLGLPPRAFSQVSLPFNLRVLQMICPRTQFVWSMRWRWISNLKSQI